MPKPKQEGKSASDFGKLFAETREQYWKPEPEEHIHNHHYYYKKNRVNFGRIAFGVTIIFFGFLYLAVNTGWLPASYLPDLWKMWPLLIIFFGLSMITGHGIISIISGVILTITTLTLAGLLILGNVQTPNDSVVGQDIINNVISQPIVNPITNNAVNTTSTTTTTTSTPAIP